MDQDNSEDIRRILSVLGSEGVLDTLLCIRELEPATASEVADEMGVHVATAVKRLSGLHDIGLLDRSVRKGKTRSAQEYSLTSRSFGLDIDLDQLAGSPSRADDDLGIYVELLEDMAERFARFSGRSPGDTVASWEERLDVPFGLLGGRMADDVTVDAALGLIAGVLELEGAEFGEMTARSVLEASLESVVHTGELRDYLESRLLGGG